MYFGLIRIIGRYTLYYEYEYCVQYKIIIVIIIYQTILIIYRGFKEQGVAVVKNELNNILSVICRCYARENIIL